MATDHAQDDFAPQRQTGLVGFLIPVVAVAGLGAGGLFLYQQNVVKKQEIGERARKARDKMYKHDLASLNEAEKLYKEILDIDAGNPEAHGALALVYYYQSNHGLETMDKARQNLGASSEAETASRYAASAYLKTANGKAVEAETDVRKLFEQEIGAPVIAHAMGVALFDQNKFVEANRIIRQAQESAFSAVAFQLSLAEIAHRQGEDRAAVKHLRGIVRDSMNPNHHVARAYLAALQLKNYGILTSPAQNIEKVKKHKDNLSPRAKAYLTWANGELMLAVGNAKGAIEKAKEADKIMPGYAPFADLEARALHAQGKYKKAIAAYRKAVDAKPPFRGPRWKLAELLSEMKDDAALAVVDELEKTAVGTKGPEYEIFRADHALRKGEVEKAKALFTKAAELGDNPDILFGLARVTFEEEKAKGNKADIEKVATQITLALDKKRLYPEVNEYLGEISLWNYLVPGANASFKTAEEQYKKLKRPIPEIVRFYDRVINQFKSVKERKLKREAKKFAKEWREKKKEYLRSVVTAS